MPATVDNILRWWASEQKDRPALCVGQDIVTYEELDRWVGRVAARFCGDGLNVGDRFCIYAANSIEWCVAALAAMRAGGVVAGLNARMVPEEIAYLLGDYAPALLLTDDECGERIATIGPLLSKSGEPVAPPLRISIEQIRALRDGGDPVDVRRDVDPEVVSVIVTTSGSTARPKGVMWSNRTIIDYNAAYIIEDPIDIPHPKIVIVAPLTTSAGFIQFMQAVIQGGTGYLQQRFEPEVVLDLIAREQINIFCGAPIFFQRVAECPQFAATDVSSIKIAQTGGAPVAVRLLKIWADKGVLVRQIYGQTEISGCAVVNPRRFALSHPEKCGRGSALRDIAIIDAEGRFLPPGQEGQIVLRGHGMMLGYWNNPEATAETIVDGWLRTGDIGVIDESGLLQMVGRIKDIIISGGLNIAAAEVERVLDEAPGIEEVAVIGVADDRFGEVPLAIVYGKQGLTALDLHQHCAKHLSGFKVPRYIAIHAEPLPRLATGKISKPELRRQYAAAESLPPPVR